MRLILASLLGTLGWAGAATAADLALTIAGARSTDGVVSICLWSDGQNFPDCGKSKTAERRTVAASALGKPIVFSGLKPGTFAISALHDENDNGKLDTNLIGIPKEGIAVSNDAMPKFSAPRFAETAFALTGDADQRITLVYR
ncbi:DUF2141 domain-containing protein [Aureimonas glaciei]|uniref:DUF2141 domain-containing protein n=1 Tax=Aureimonas glaciei TaxID=1776957 RepID=A0A916XY35_9HYPH|nr:DUF2141 domain-containing protein [Aureimonas glaciei]GGD20817.1 hypothetical protein GCM10011335_24670 [Aureimonas glaciei]